MFSLLVLREVGLGKGASVHRLIFLLPNSKTCAGANRDFPEEQKKNHPSNPLT